MMSKWTSNLEQGYLLVNNSIHKPPAGENLKGSTVTARVCLMGVNTIDAGGL